MKKRTESVTAMLPKEYRDIAEKNWDRADVIIIRRIGG